MSNLMPSELTADVLTVLRQASRGKGDRPNFLTAYQILNRLPVDIKSRLIEERGSCGGREPGECYSATSVVAQAAQMLVPAVIVEYLDSEEVTVRVNGESITPGNEVCAMYRVASEEATDSLLGSVTITGDIVGPFHDAWQGVP